MTRITLPDDLVEAVDQAFPNEEIEAVVERLLRQEVAKRQKPVRGDLQAVLAAIDRIREHTSPLSNDEIRQLRQEGRK